MATKRKELYKKGIKALPHKFAEAASDGKWKPYTHLVNLSKYIAKGISGGNLRLIVSMPPRHGKSELMSHWIPTWFLEWFSEKRIILSTYGDDFATKWGRKVRNELKENNFCSTNLASDKEAASNFYTQDGGGMLSAGIRGGITGEGADLMIVDDPIKNWEQAQSKGTRDKINDEFEATLNTRLEPDASVIVLMTRWHSEDLAGFANNEYDWEFLRYPAISDGDSVENNHLDNRGDVGQALCPERYTIDDLEKRKNDLRSKMWEALYQQTPIDQQEDSLWSYKIINYSDEPLGPSKFNRIVVGVDPAVTSNEKSDETGIVVCGEVNNGEYVVIDDASLKGTPSRWANVAVSVYKKYDADRIVAEDNQGGDMVEQMIRDVDPGVSYKGVRATRGKVLRAEPIVALYESERVKHNKQFTELESQMIRFAGEKVDDSPDRMDALVWALTEMNDNKGSSLTWGS